jgi:hypothetical protein
VIVGHGHMYRPSSSTTKCRITCRCTPCRRSRRREHFSSGELGPSSSSVSPRATTRNASPGRRSTVLDFQGPLAAQEIESDLVILYLESLMR